MLAFLTMLVAFFLLPCEGRHLWKFDPYPGSTMEESWYCVLGYHRGRTEFPWD